MSELNEWQRIIKLCSFEKEPLIQVSVVDEYVQKLQSKITELEQQVKTLKHDGEVLNRYAMKLEEQLEERLEEYKKRLCE